jgi:hypothetical protein|tara:strand:- start:1592 stop:1705 length:114 start_codon:yes stop_codon:yes gene_type:complete
MSVPEIQVLGRQSQDFDGLQYQGTTIIAEGLTSSPKV